MIGLWLFLRFLLALLCAVLSVHLIVLWDNWLSWWFTLFASEYGHRFAMLAVILLPFGFVRPGWISRMGTVMLVLSAVILLWPVVQSKSIARRLPQGMETAFKTLAGDEKYPEVVYKGLWFGASLPVQPAPAEYIFTAEGVAPLKLLFHPATGRPNAPCILNIHGGGWKNGTPADFPKWNTYWSSQGYAVASIEYRLAPQNRWPAPREDTRAALEWLKANAQKLGIDASSFIIVGRSAGGQIATACAYGFNDPAIIGCVSIYGPADMIFARRFAFDDDVLKSLVLIRDYLGGDPDQVPEAYASSSGYLLVNAQSCPTLQIHGPRDIMVWNMQSRRLAAKLDEYGVPNYLLELPWGTHGFDWPFDTPGGQLTRYAVDQFFKTVSEKKRVSP